MRRSTRWPIVFLIVCPILLVRTVSEINDRATAAAQTRNPLMVTRLYTSADGQTQAEGLTGQGRITRVMRNEDRVAIQFPLAEQPIK